MLLCLFAYPHVKRVVSESCERVISCRVRAFTLFPEIPWRVTFHKTSCDWWLKKYPIYIPLYSQHIKEKSIEGWVRRLFSTEKRLLAQGKVTRNMSKDTIFTFYIGNEISRLWFLLAVLFFQLDKIKNCERQSTQMFDFDQTFPNYSYCFI